MQGVNVEPVDPESAIDPDPSRKRSGWRRLFPGAGTGETGATDVFVPDDLVAIGEAGMRIVGRVSDVINVAGKKVNPAEVEAHLLSHAGVRQAVVFGRASALRNQEVVACVVAVEKIERSGSS